MFVLHLLRPVLKRRKLPIYKRRINFRKLKGLDSTILTTIAMQSCNLRAMLVDYFRYAPLIRSRHTALYKRVLIN